jgi:UDP-2-acetamido-3-amino-2,3-dideoxy-glucuronate N-acetyltransferase
MSSKIAVVGCGYWGKNLVRNFAQLKALRWICDEDRAVLKALRPVFSQARATTSFQDILDAADVRGVVIATPASQHYTQAKAAILARKDVFIEKPLALHYDQGQELVDLAESRGVILMVGHVLEYHPAVALLRDVVSRGELGRVLYIYSNRLNLGKVRQVENILWSFAPHDIAVICSLAGAAPRTVRAFGSSYLQTGVEDVTVTNLDFDGGLHAHIFVSWLHPYKEQKLVVVGDRKMAVFDDAAREGKLKIYDKGIDWRSGVPVPRQTSETTLFVDETEPLRLECLHFLASMHSRIPPLTDGPSALRVLRVLEASQSSLERAGAAVHLEEVKRPCHAAAAQ